MRREKECLINITGSAAGCKMLRTVATESKPSSHSLFLFPWKRRIWCSGVKKQAGTEGLFLDFNERGLGNEFACLEQV